MDLQIKYNLPEMKDSFWGPYKVKKCCSMDELKHFTCSLPRSVCGAQAGIGHTYLPSLLAYSYICQCCHTGYWENL